MDERALTTVSVDLGHGVLPSALFPDLVSLSDIEIWTSRSKIVNEHISTLKTALVLVALVDPLCTPLWAIVDKPYNVYTSNDNTAAAFQTILNHSETSGNVSHRALLTRVPTNENVFLMFYTELSSDSSATVKCIVLEVTVLKLQQIVENESHKSGTHFIDEQRKEELMDALLRQRLQPFSKLSSKRQAEASVQEQQLKLKRVRQEFKRIISKEVKLAMQGQPKANWTEVGDICYRAMGYKFKGLLEITDQDFEEIVKWLHVFLGVLGVTEERETKASTT